MFPWSPEFIWDAGHVAFFGAFYGVALTIVTVLLVSGARAWRDTRQGRAPALVWHATFEELPAQDRACRHQLTGEAPGRVCDNAFDCRCCQTHPLFLARQAAAPALPIGDAQVAGLDFPADRLYHRGHAFVRPEADGTVSVGLDPLARRLVGAPEDILLPDCGARLVANAPAFRITAGGSHVRVLSPVDGRVVAISGAGADVTLRVDPGGPLDCRHLLSGAEVRPWALRELERLQGLMAPGQVGPALADGGELIADLGPALPAARRDGILGEMFLDLD